MLSTNAGNAVVLNQGGSEGAVCLIRGIVAYTDA
jgi:hypothetical protein